MSLYSRAIHVEASHVSLLRKMRAVWVPIEAGVPYVELERPYGSEEIADDVRRLIGDTSLTEDAAWVLHREALRRLPILVQAGELTPGKYSGSSVSGDQITLLRSLRMAIDLDPEKSCPLNFKRPYGDMTAYELDMADILGIAGELTQQQCEELWGLHESLADVLQVWLEHAAFEPGVYEETDAETWRKLELPGDRIALRVLTQSPAPSALFDALANRDLDEARRLLERGADPRAIDDQGHTVMNLVMKQHDLQAVRTLLGVGVGINEPLGRGRWSPLALAAANGATEIFAELLRNGGDLSIASVWGTSVLGYAVAYGHTAIVAQIEASGWSEVGALGVTPYSGTALTQAQQRTRVESDAVVENVCVRSTADRLGIAVDDCIVAIDGEPVASFADVRRVLAKKRYGSEIAVALRRRGEVFEARGKLGPKIGEPYFKYPTQ